MLDPSFNSAMHVIGEEQVRQAVAKMSLGERLLRAYRQNDDVLFDAALQEVEKLSDENIIMRESLKLARVTDENFESLKAELRTFANEHVCPVNENCQPGFVSGAYSAWGWARNHIAKLLVDA